MDGRSHVLFKIEILLILFLAIILVACAGQQAIAEQIDRISVEDARMKTKGGGALLVCSYDDSKCKEILLEGAILRSEFESKLPALSKNQEIIFYCG